MPQPPLNPTRIRDHLANERTYLAWIRTAVALMGFGVVIVRLRYLLPPQLQTHAHGWELGLLFAVMGLLTVPIAAIHYFKVRDAIETLEYRPASRWVIVFTAAIALIGAGVLYVLLSTPLAPAVPPNLPMDPEQFIP